MTTVRLLRIVSVIAFIQFAGHGTMFVRAQPTNGTEEVAVVDAMRSHAFRFALAPRTYWDMYYGYGLEAAFVCLVEAVLFWLLAGSGPGNGALIRSVAGLFAIANVAHIVMLVRYFAFPVPMVFDGLIVVGLIGVTAALGRSFSDRVIVACLHHRHSVARLKTPARSAERALRASDEMDGARGATRPSGSARRLPPLVRTRRRPQG